MVANSGSLCVAIQQSLEFSNEDRFRVLLNDVATQPVGKSLSELMPEIAAQWDVKKNGALSPALFSVSSGHKAWWHCDKGHSYESSIKSRTRGHGCPFCSGNKLLREDSLAVKYPELVCEWIQEKNIESPYEVSVGTRKKVWWKCSEGHEWETSIVYRTKGSGCPVCSGRIVSKEKNLSVTQPKVAAEWNYEKNEGLLPNQFRGGSHKKVWWKCINNHEWIAEIKSRALSGRGCPECRKIGKNKS